MRKLIILILCIAAIIAAFIYHPVAGIVLILVLLGLSFYIGRASVFLLLSKAEAGKGNPERARHWLDKAYGAASHQANIAIHYSYELLRDHETERAAEVLASIPVNTLPKELEISYKLNQSIVLWRQGEREKSIELVEQLYAKYKNTVIYGTLGYYYLLNDQLEQALELNEEAYDFNDSNNAILDNLGLTYYYLERYDEALTIFEKLMQGNPTFREAYYNIGLVFEQLGRIQEAYEHYQQAITHKPALVTHVTTEEIEAKLTSLEEQLGNKEDSAEDDNSGNVDP